MTPVNDKKINFAAVEIIKLTGDLDFTPKEALEATLKAMHFIIEKGFCQTPEKTCELISRAMGTIIATTAASMN